MNIKKVMEYSVQSSEGIEPSPLTKQRLTFFLFQEGELNAKEEYGQSPDFSINDALWTCSNVFADVVSKVASRRIILLTNNDQPHATRPDLEVS